MLSCNKFITKERKQMNNNIKLFLFIYFFAILAYANNKQHDITLSNQNFSFQKLYASNDDSSFLYNPEIAIIACPRIPIWPADPNYPFPNPNITDTDCGISTQMSLGCTKVNPINSELVKSVFRITTPDPNKSCSAVLVDQKYILTSAGCLTSRVGAKLQIPVMHILQATASHNGYLAYDQVIPAEVKAIYIPADYYKRPMVQNDLALIELDKALPMPSYQPVNLFKDPVTFTKNYTGISTGYGHNEYGTFDGLLRYRKSYFYADHERWFQVANTLVTKYKAVDSAWMLSSPGDAGGPFLIGSPGKYYLVGILSNNRFCKFSPFFAKTPYSLNAYTSMIEKTNQKFINKIITNKILTNDKVKCFAVQFEGCDHIVQHQNMFVISMDQNKISSLNLEADDNWMNVKTTTTGVSPNQLIASYTTHDSYIYVNNLISKSISSFQTDFAGNMIAKNSYPLNDKEIVKNIQLYSKRRDHLLTISNRLTSFAVSKADGQLNIEDSISLGFNPNSSALIENKSGVWLGYIQAKKENDRHADTVIGFTQIKEVEKKVSLFNNGFISLEDYDEGLPLQIAPTYLDNKGQFYLLTDKGIYFYKMSTEPDSSGNHKVTFVTRLAAYKVQAIFEALGLKGVTQFSQNTTITPISDYALVISNSDGRELLLLNFSKDYQKYTVIRQPLPGIFPGGVILNEEQDGDLYVPLTSSGEIAKIELKRKKIEHSDGTRTKIWEFGKIILIPTEIANPYKLIFKTLGSYERFD